MHPKAHYNGNEKKDTLKLKKRLDVTHHTLNAMRMKLLENPYYKLDVYLHLEWEEWRMREVSAQDEALRKFSRFIALRK